MRVYGQNLGVSQLEGSTGHRGPGGATRMAALATERRRVSERAADVVGLRQDAGEPAHEDWLRRLDTFEQLELAFDEQDRILWCFMDPPGRPSVTFKMVQEGRTLQRSIQQLFRERPGAAEAPIRYMVWSSKIPGIYNLGGDLRLFAELIRKRDREGLLAYATACIDVVYGNAVNLDLPLVTIALVRGDALGGGFECALSCSLVIAERSAKFGLPEMLFNLFPGMGAYSLISRRIGAAQAERIIMSARIYTAEELYELGLVDVLADDGAGEAAVFDYVEQYGRRHSAHCAVYNVRRRVNPLGYDELLDVTQMWVESALALGESDLRRMERLVAAQERRAAALGRSA